MFTCSFVEYRLPVIRDGTGVAEYRLLREVKISLYLARMNVAGANVLNTSVIAGSGEAGLVVLRLAGAATTSVFGILAFQNLQNQKLHDCISFLKYLLNTHSHRKPREQSPRRSEVHLDLCE